MRGTRQWIGGIEGGDWGVKFSKESNYPGHVLDRNAFYVKPTEVTREEKKVLKDAQTTHMHLFPAGHLWDKVKEYYEENHD